jgi:hypothetical protein
LGGEGGAGGDKRVWGWEQGAGGDVLKEAGDLAPGCSLRLGRCASSRGRGCMPSRLRQWSTGIAPRPLYCENALASAQGVPVQVIEVLPAPVTAEWLARKVPELRGIKKGGGATFAAGVVAAFKKAGLLDSSGMFAVGAGCGGWGPRAQHCSRPLSPTAHAHPLWPFPRAPAEGPAPEHLARSSQVGAGLRGPAPRGGRLAAVRSAQRGLGAPRAGVGSSRGRARLFSSGASKGGAE